MGIPHLPKRKIYDVTCGNDTSGIIEWINFDHSSNCILFADSEVTILVNWFHGLSNLDYRQRRYTLSLVIGYYVDKEALVTIRGRHESSQMQSMTASTTITVQFQP